MGDRPGGLDEVLVELGRRVYAKRKLLGLSQEAMGLKAGLQRAHVGFIEQGKNDVRFSTALKVAYALDLDIGDLLRGLALSDPPDPR